MGSKFEALRDILQKKDIQYSEKYKDKKLIGRELGLGGNISSQDINSYMPLINVYLKSEVTREDFTPFVIQGNLDGLRKNFEQFCKTIPRELKNLHFKDNNSLFNTTAKEFAAGLKQLPQNMHTLTLKNCHLGYAYRKPNSRGGELDKGNEGKAFIRICKSIPNVSNLDLSDNEGLKSLNISDLKKGLAQLPKETVVTLEKRKSAAETLVKWELEAYIKTRTKEQQSSGVKQYHTGATHWARYFKKEMSADNKINAATKLLNLLNKEKVDFTAQDLKCLKDGRLGKLFKEYKGKLKSVLPEGPKFQKIGR